MLTRHCNCRPQQLGLQLGLQLGWMSSLVCDGAEALFKTLNPNASTHRLLTGQDADWTLWLQAAALGLLSFLVCPVAEAVLMKFAGVWHYPRADLFIGGEGVTSWYSF